MKRILLSIALSFLVSHSVFAAPCDQVAKQMAETDLGERMDEACANDVAQIQGVTYDSKNGTYTYNMIVHCGPVDTYNDVVVTDRACNPQWNPDL